MRGSRESPLLRSIVLLGLLLSVGSVSAEFDSFIGAYPCSQSSLSLVYTQLVQTCDACWHRTRRLWTAVSALESLAIGCISIGSGLLAVAL